jgi:hypothetical protein
MGGSSGSGTLLKFATVLLIIAFLLHLIAIGAPNWASTDATEAGREEHLGLWKYCTYPYGGGESCNDFVDIIVGDWLKAAQAFMILAMFTIPAAIGIVAMCSFVPDYADDMRVLGAAMAVTFIAGLFTLITVATFGDKFQEYFNNKEPNLWVDIGQLDWAFGLCVTDGILTFIALGLQIASLSD